MRNLKDLIALLLNKFAIDKATIGHSRITHKGGLYVRRIVLMNFIYS